MLDRYLLGNTRLRYTRYREELYIYRIQAAYIFNIDQGQGVPVEAYNSVGKVERYYTLIRRAYDILREELKDENIDREIILQIAVKAVNDSAGPDRIILTLLIFSAYPRITEIDPPSTSVVKRAKAMRAATKEVRRLHAERQVNDGTLLPYATAPIPSPH